MDRIFFSKNNYNVIYNIIGEKIYKEFKYDIADNDKYETELVNIMKSIYSQKQNLNISNNLSTQNYSNQLSKKVLDISINHFSKNFIKKKNDILNKIDSRPQPSIIRESDDVNRAYEKIQNERNNNFQAPRNENIDFSDKIQENTNNVNSQFENLSKSREKEFADNPNNDPSNNAWANNNNNNRKPLEQFKQQGFQDQFKKQEEGNFREQFKEQQMPKLNNQRQSNQQYSNQQHSNQQYSNQQHSNQQHSNQQQNNQQQNNQQQNNQQQNNQQQNNQQQNNKISMNIQDIKPYGGEFNSNLDNQFNSMSQDTNNFNSLKEHFESKSVSERLKEFQINRQIDIQPNDIQENNTQSNNIQSTDIQENNTQSNNIQSTDIQSNDIQVNDIQSNNIQSNINNLQYNLSSINNKITPSMNNILKNQPNYSIKTYNLIINSIDREWHGIINKDTVYPSNYTKRYKYTVNFAPMSNSTIKIPVYENNEYCPLFYNVKEDKIKILKGIRDKNNTGCTFKGKSLAPYDSNKPKGDIVGYETRIIKSSTDGISTDKTFRNVVSVKLKRLIMPSFDKFCSYEKEYNSIVNIPTGFKTEPYILLHIDELDSNIITTNNINKSIFCKAHFDKEFCYKTLCPNRGYTYYCNSDEDIKLFYPSPLSELNKLSIEILKSNGKLYSDEDDDLEIKTIMINDENTIEIVLNRFVNNNYFKLGDKILIKELTKMETAPAELNNQILEYLETELFVSDVDNSDKPNTNKVYIKNKITGIDTSGNNIFLTIVPDNYQYKGFILNVSQQHSMVLEIQTQVTDSLSVIKPNII